MRTCIVFRGENERQKWGYMSSLECVDNWKETILHVIDCDVVFFTYESTILSQLIQKLSPIHVCTSGYHSQESNSLTAINWMVKNKDRYDRFVFVRFDFMYRKHIIDWPHWQEKGIILTNKDVHYPRLRLYADNLFIIDKEWIEHFKDAFVAEGKYKICLHHIGRYLEEMADVPLHVMYPDYYYMSDHPLYALFPQQPRPQLGDHYNAKKIADISPWNSPQTNPTPSVVVPPPKKMISKQQTKTKKRTHSRPFIIFYTK